MQFTRILLIILSFGLSAFASCPEDFEKITFSCLKKERPSFKPVVIKFEKEKKAQIINSVYYFKTATGSLGKFKILDIKKESQSCSIHLDISTYTSKGVFAPSGSLAIKKEFGKWTMEQRSFDHSSDKSFKLAYKNKVCYFKAENAKLKYREDLELKLAGSDLIQNAGLFLIGLAVFMIAFTIFKEEDSFKAQSTLEDASDETDKDEAPNDIVLRYSKPFFKRYFTPIVEGMKNKKKIKNKYKRLLASSGLSRYLTPEDFFAFKLFLIIGFPIVFLGVRWFLEESWPLTMVPLVSVLGYHYPNIWIKGKIQKRQKEILNAMPFVVDMLALSVEAGLDFMAAMQKVIEKAPNSALVEEFEILVKETKVGASRADGLRQLGWRVDMLPISSFCATLIAADAVGASIGPILKTLAGEVRQKRSAEIEKMAATASTKILFPTLGFIIPAVFIMIAVPLLMDYMNGG